MRALRNLLIALAGMISIVPASAQVTSVLDPGVDSRLLAAQNAERQRLGIKPLVWNSKLADHARKWAKTLAVADMFEHSVSAADGGEGENLWFGSKGDYSPEEMIGFFVDERTMFKKGVFPDVSTTGRWEDVGHYTQLIWKDTREVGCAIASNARRDLLVCRYTPAGNTVGETVYGYLPAARQVMPFSLSMPAKRVSKKHRRGG
jgi:hypothetical protein